MRWRGELLGWRARVSVVLGLIVALSVAHLKCSALYAQPAPQTQQAKLAQAQRLVEEGTLFFRQKEYLKGIEAYRAAQKIIPDVKNLYIIATAYGYLPDQCPATLNAWADFFKQCKDQCPYRDKALEGQSELNERCYVTLKVSSSTPQLSATYEGASWGVTPNISQRLVAREYKGVVFSAPGHLSYKRDITLKPKEGAREVLVTLVPNLTPSFLDANRPFLGGATGVLALTSLIYGLSQVATINDASDKVGGINAQISALSYKEREVAEVESRYRDLRVSYLNEKQRALDAQDRLWLGVGGMVVMGGLSAWLWLREDDVKIDPSLKPSLKEVSLHLTPWGGGLSVSF